MYTLNKIYYVACTATAPCGTYIPDSTLSFALVRFKGENPDIKDEPEYPLLFENIVTLDHKKRSLPYFGLGFSTYFSDGRYYRLDDGSDLGHIKELPIKALK